MKPVLILLVFSSIAASAAGPDATDAKDVNDRAPRTEDGHPDVRGVWNFSSDVPLERPLSVGRVAAGIYESACHEGNYSMRNMLSGARAEERKAAQPKQ